MLDIVYTNIKNRRLELGMTQDMLAEKMGYKDRSTIAKIETGKVDITLKQLRKLADALDTTQMKLLGWER